MFEEALSVIKTFDDEGVTTIDINDNGVYTLINPFIPTYSEQVTKIPEKSFYIIPRAGDVLKQIHISGHFTTAQLYQYDWTGCQKVVYDSIKCGQDDENVMRPFGTSGIPLLCIGKTMYLKIEDAEDNVTVKCVFGLLPSEDRKKLANFRNGDSDIGIKMIHQNGSIYQVIGMNDWSYSPNYLKKMT
jgi:hypothetical protein